MRLWVVAALIVASVGIPTKRQQFWDQGCVDGDCPAQNVHIAVTGNPTEMVVSWLTLGKTQTSAVKAGTASNNYDLVYYGDSHSYLHSDYDDVVFWNHDVVMDNLQPSTKYFYVCGDSDGGWSKEFSFVTAPDLTTLAPETNIFVYGDMGISNSQKTIQRLNSLTSTKQQGNIDMVFHVGDISYADDYNAGMYEAVWNQWFIEMEPIASSIPYMVAPGNHEYSCEHPGCTSYSANFTAYNQRFRMPNLESGGTENMWYSFDYGLVHFVVVSTETDFPNAPEPATFGNQLEWLESDLKKAMANRNNIPWVIVGGHRPIYSSSVGCSDDKGVPINEPANLQKAMENLFVKYGVDIFFCGHVHSYERSYPTIHNQRVTTSYDNPRAPIYVISGAAGNTEGLSNKQNSTWVPQPSWSAHRFGLDYGFGLLTIQNQVSSTATLEWKFFRSSDGGVEDQFTLTKNL